MFKKALAGFAIAAVMSTAMLGTAEAGNKRHLFLHKPHFKVWHGPNFVGHRCHWLKKKALFTGKRYWWKRYHRCLDFYYY